MLLNNLLLAAQQTTQAVGDEIPARPASIAESLKLMGEGWGAIFIVIIVMMLFILVLNRVFREKKKKE